MITAEEVQKDDVPILEHLVDIKYSNKLGEGKKGFQLAFVFSKNEYFEQEVLTKTYLMDPDDDDECLTKAIGTDITWKPGKNVTVRMVQKKQKKKGKVRTIKVEEPTDSFFQFFDPPEVPEEEDEMEEEEVCADATPDAATTSPPLLSPSSCRVDNVLPSRTQSPCGQTSNHGVSLAN